VARLTEARMELNRVQARKISAENYRALHGGQRVMQFIKGEKIYLRPLLRTDLNAIYLGWVNDAEVTSFMIRPFPLTMEGLEGYYEHMTQTYDNVIFAICTLTGEHIGNVTLNEIDWISRVANTGIMIGHKEFWHLGIGTEATRLLVYYAFNTLNLRKIWAGVNEKHEHSIKMYEKNGFQYGACLEKELYYRGSYLNKMIMSIFRSRTE